MLPYTRFCNTNSGSPLDSTWNSKNRNHANIQESHVKWIKIRMMQAPNPPSRPQWTGKQSLLTADNCISGLSLFYRQNSKRQNLVQIQESHQNRTKIASLKNAAKRRNWIEVNRKWPKLYANVTTSGSPLDTARNSKHRNQRKKTRNHT